MIKVTNARFLQSCERFSQAPSILGAEIAILGRSNVGKSSLINALLNHKNLAKSSATPGKTRLINFFSAKWKVDCADLINSQNLGENKAKITESSADSANRTKNAESNSVYHSKSFSCHSKSFSCHSERSEESKNNPSLRADSQNLRGNPLCNSCVDSAIPSPLISIVFSRKRAAPPCSRSPQLHLNEFPKSCRFSLLGGEPRLSASSKKSAGGTSAPFDSDFLHHEAGEFKGASHRFNRDSSLRLRSAQNDKNGVRVAESSETTPQDAEFAEFEIKILDFPGFGYAKVSKAEKSSWDRHLSEFLNKRDSIKLYLHLIDARHQNLAIDNEIFAFLNRFKRGDSAILQVFTKADKLGKNELTRLKKQNKFYHAINDKNSTEILRIEILKTLYNVDF